MGIDTMRDHSQDRITILPDIDIVNPKLENITRTFEEAFPSSTSTTTLPISKLTWGNMTGKTSTRDSGVPAKKDLVVSRYGSGRLGMYKTEDKIQWVDMYKGEVVYTFKNSAQEPTTPKQTDESNLWYQMDLNK